MIKTSWEGNCFLNFFNNKSSLGNVDKTIFKSKSTSPFMKGEVDLDLKIVLSTLPKLDLLLKKFKKQLPSQLVLIINCFL